MNHIFMASKMCADHTKLGQEVIGLDEAGIDSFHIDIMDGRYVNNFAMSLNDLRAIRKMTKKPLDVHLMVEHPLNTIDLFIRALNKGDTIYIHPEAEYHPSTTLQRIINADMVPGIAINPGTSVETIYEMLRIVDKVLVMTVNPGNAAQMYLPYVGEKYEKLLPYREEMRFDVFWDGACTADKVRQFSRKGVKGFVLGTNLLFGKNRPYKDILNDIHGLLPNEGEPK